MKHPQLTLLAAVGLAAGALPAQIQIDTVFVGDAGNPNDSTGFGGVSYDYHIGTYEVTNGQYTAFLNAVAETDTHGLYSTSMDGGSYGGISRSGSSGSYSYSTIAGRENNPVNYVSFWDAARFANWLTNGQPTGAQDLSTTEDGMYFLNGITNPTNDTVVRLLSFAASQNGVAVANENEWFKAAYYSGNFYWLYPTASNSITTADANYANSVGTVTAVGTYVSDPSHYGTFDQGGIVWEWNDAIVSTSNRGLRGGSFDLNDFFFLQSSVRIFNDPTLEINSVGFRVSSLAPIPEPSTYAAIVGGLGLLIALKRRKGRGTL